MIVEAIVEVDAVQTLDVELSMVASDEPYEQTQSNSVTYLSNMSIKMLLLIFF